MLKIAVLGAGHLGKIHLRCLKNIPQFEVIGVYDPNEENARVAHEYYGVTPWRNMEALIDAADVVDVVTPTLSHYDCARMAAKKLKHIFIEKPLTNTVQEAEQLIALVREAGIKVQVGHVERYNPAFIAAGNYDLSPKFIEAHRLSTFNPRGTDVPIVHDLMIHDLDIMLSVVKSNIRQISASGVSVVSDTPDIANARIEFENGCVANLTASRISLKSMRKMRFFQQDAYISVDFLEKKTEIFKLNNPNQLPDANTTAMEIDLGPDRGKKLITFEVPPVPEINAIQSELEDFANAIIKNTEPNVTIQDGYRALKVADQIVQLIAKNRMA